MPGNRPTPSAVLRRRRQANAVRRTAAATRGERALSRKHDRYLAAVDRLTNWQRSQWARAGYPGTRDRDPEQITSFLTRIKQADQFGGAA